MTKTATLKSLILFTCGILVGGFLFSQLKHSGVPTAAVMEQTAAKTSVPDASEMQADIAHLKEVVPSQPHTMTDVAYQFSCLWFAGKESNWPLASFFLNEARHHIRWTIRIRPIRKDLGGYPVDLKGIYDGIDDSVMAKLQQAIGKKDRPQFVAAY